MIWTLTRLCLILSHWVLSTRYISGHVWNEIYKLEKEGEQKEHKPATDLRRAFAVTGTGSSFPLFLLQNAMIVPHDSLLSIRKGTTSISCAVWKYEWLKMMVQCLHISGNCDEWADKCYATFLDHSVSMRGVPGQIDSPKTCYLSDFDENSDIW